MNCKQARRLLTQRFLGDLDSSTDAEIGAHLEKCEGCRAAARDVESTLDLLRTALAASAPALQRLPQPQRDQILGGRPAARTRRRIFWMVDSHPRLAMAAGLALVVGLAWMTVLRPGSRSATIPDGGDIATALSPEPEPEMEATPGLKLLETPRLAAMPEPAKSAPAEPVNAGAAFDKDAAKRKAGSAGSGAGAPSADMDTRRQEAALDEAPLPPPAPLAAVAQDREKETGSRRGVSDFVSLGRERPASATVAEAEAAAGDQRLHGVAMRAAAAAAPVRLPPAGMMRVAEFVNGFDYAYAPSEPAAFLIHADGAPSLFRPGLHVLKIGVIGPRAVPDGTGAASASPAEEADVRVEFNPRRVRQFRPIGGDGVPTARAGQSVTTLYELRLAGAESGEAWSPPSPGWTAPDRAGRWPDDVIGAIRVQGRRPDGGPGAATEKTVRTADVAARFDDAPARFRLAVCAAEFAEIRTGSAFAAGSAYADVAGALRPVAMELHHDAQVQNLLRMTEAACAGE